MTSNNPTSKNLLLEKLDKYFENKDSMILWMSIILTTVFGILLFEPKVSIGGDDSMYINRAYNFIHKGTFPTFQGPLYPIFLSLIISIVGVNLIFLKIVSMLCYLGHQWFTFKIFKNRLSPFLQFTFFFLISSSAAILFYSCSTYNEVFYIFLQSVFLYHFVTSFIKDDPNEFDLKRDYKNLMISGLLLMFLASTKNIGLVAAMASVIYFLFAKKWKMSLAIAVSFIFFMMIFSFVKSTFWEIKEIQMSSQLDALMTKVPYKQDSGQEDAYGFLMRLVGNSKVYFGYHFRNIFGLALGKEIEPNSLVTLLIYGIFIPGFFIAMKKSKFWLFIGVFTSTALGATFLILQTFWLQERLIIVFTPLLLVFLLYSLQSIFSGKLRKYSNILVLVCFIFILANLIRSFTRMPQQIEVNTKYLSGDVYYGFPEDWIYYLKMTKWANDNLPQDAYVACRKPGMAFIYSGGKDFYGIWKVPSNDPELLYRKLKDAGVTHVIMASLRTNPDDPTNTRIINTVRRYLKAINDAYPGKLKLVHKIGDNWPTYLYELN